MHLRPSEDGNHLPKHVGVNLEYSNTSASSLAHLLFILQRYYKMLGPTIKISLEKLRIKCFTMKITRFYV
jgi:hypothetical protein